MAAASCGAVKVARNIPATTQQSLSPNQRYWASNYKALLPNNLHSLLHWLAGRNLSQNLNRFNQLLDNRPGLYLK
jgi:hypothetical protein